MKHMLIVNIIKSISCFIVFTGTYKITDSSTDGLLAVIILLLYSISEDLDYKDLKSRGMIK